MARSKYKYYNYKKEPYRNSSEKSKSKKKRQTYDEFADIKEDFSNLVYDIKKVFRNRKNKIIKNKSYNTKNEMLAKKACIGIIGFAIMSLVLTFPIAVVITLILSFVYMKR